jgi:hypothetical protein
MTNLERQSSRQIFISIILCLVSVLQGLELNTLRNLRVFIQNSITANTKCLHSISQNIWMNLSLTKV